MPSVEMMHYFITHENAGLPSIIIVLHSDEINVERYCCVC
jgi:hypothetical protein